MDEKHFEKLEAIENNLVEIRRILKPTRWQMFVQGMWRAVGYLIGLILAIAIIGWFLNIIGLVPAFSTFSQNMQEILNIARTK
jgi:hypothetical protein